MLTLPHILPPDPRLACCLTWSTPHRALGAMSKSTGSPFTVHCRASMPWPRLGAPHTSLALPGCRISLRVMWTGLGRRLLLSCPDPGWRRLVNWRITPSAMVCCPVILLHAVASLDAPCSVGLRRVPKGVWLQHPRLLLIDRHYYNSKNACPDARAPACVRRVRSVAVSGCQCVSSLIRLIFHAARTHWFVSKTFPRGSMLDGMG